jgi:hypothetical protein
VGITYIILYKQIYIRISIFRINTGKEWKDLVLLKNWVKIRKDTTILILKICIDLIYWRGKKYELKTYKYTKMSILYDK